MDLDLFYAYKEATGNKKRLLLEKLVKQNERLVGKFVDRLIKRSKIRVCREDCYQAGLIGLCKTFEKLDPTKGKLSTYAAHWIRYEVQREILRHTDIYRPERTGVPYDVTQVQERVLSACGRAATADELSEALGRDITEEQVENWRQEAPVYDRTMVSKEELSGPEEQRPDVQLDTAEAAKKVFDAVEKLRGKEKQVVLLMADGLAPKEICQRLGISAALYVKYRDRAKEKIKARL